MIYLLIVLWWTLPTILNLLLVLCFYDPYSWEFRDWRITCLTRKPMWGDPDGQSLGSLVQVYRTQFDRDTTELVVHETNHSAWGLCLGLGFWVWYGVEFLLRLVFGRRPQKGEPWWHPAYHELWLERRARKVADEYERGLRS